MIDNAFMLVFSLIVLGRSAKIVIDNSLRIARFLGISELAVGFLMLSVSTSLPELMVGLIAAIENQPGISLGTILGANISDLGLVLGLAVFMSRIEINNHEKSTLKKILLVSAMIPLLLIAEPTVFIGIVLLVIYSAYAYFILQEKMVIDGMAWVTRRQAARSFFLFGLGAILLMASAKFAVDSAVSIADSLGVAKSFIAATTIALGATLPELSVSITAIRTKRIGLAIGNAIGSCITNLTLILGLSGMIIPLQVVNLSSLYNLIAFHTCICFLVLALLTYRKIWGRKDGALLIGAYFLFIASAIIIEVMKIMKM